MSVRATPEISGHCSRCERDVRTVKPWAHWRKARWAYFGGLLVALFCTPVILCDGFVLIPLLMVFIAAIGPLNAMARKRPTCADCGAIVDAAPQLRAAPTPVPVQG